MTTESLASLKKNFGITDELSVKYERKGDELVLHIPLQSTYVENDMIINKARKLVQQKKQKGWTRQDFFTDFMKVREQVINKVRAIYGEK